MNKLVKYIGEDTISLTKDKLYTATAESSHFYEIIDDEGDAFDVDKEEMEDLHIPGEIFINGVKFVPYQDKSEN